MSGESASYAGAAVDHNEKEHHLPPTPVRDSNGHTSGDADHATHLPVSPVPTEPDPAPVLSMSSSITAATDSSPSGLLKRCFDVEMPAPRTGPKLSHYQIKLTVVYAWAFGYCGILMSCIGPAMLVLGEHTGASVAQMGYTLSARSIGYVCGSSIGGPLFDRMEGHRLILGALTCAAVATFCVPFITSLPLLAATISVQGVAMGFLDVGGNVMLLWLHPVFPDPYMQMIHFMFGAGSTVTPLVLSAFMASHGSDITLPFCVLSLFLLPIVPPLLMWKSPPNPAPAAEVPPLAPALAPESVVVSPPAAGGGGGAGAGGGDEVPALFTNTSAAAQSSICGRISHAFEHWQMCSMFSRRERVVITLVAVYLGVYVGSEVAMGALIYSYCVLGGLADDVNAAYLNSAFWGLFAFGRLMAIPLSTRLPPQLMLYGNIIGCLGSMLLVILAPDNWSVVVTAVCFYGFSMASCFPSCFALADHYLEVTAKVGTWFVIGSAIGEMLIPFVMTQLFDINRHFLFYISFGTAVLGLILIATLTKFGVKRKRLTAPAPPAADGSSSLELNTSHTQAIHGAAGSDSLYPDSDIPRTPEPQPPSIAAPGGSGGTIRNGQFASLLDEADSAGSAGFVSTTASPTADFAASQHQHSSGDINPNSAAGNASEWRQLP